MQRDRPRRHINNGFSIDFDFASLYPYQQSIINLNIKNLIRKMKIKKIYGLLEK